MAGENPAAKQGRTSIDDFQRVMVLIDGTVIPVDDIFEMESDLFRGLE